MRHKKFYKNKSSLRDTIKVHIEYATRITEGARYPQVTEPVRQRLEQGIKHCEWLLTNGTASKLTLIRCFNKLETAFYRAYHETYLLVTGQSVESYSGLPDHLRKPLEKALKETSAAARDGRVSKYGLADKVFELKKAFFAAYSGSRGRS
jgi:hypothetical protein